jgi:hypothetical protein
MFKVCDFLCAHIFWVLHTHTNKPGYNCLEFRFVEIALHIIQLLN